MSERTERPRDLNGDIRETHVSAEPPCSQAPSRLSQAHADRRWSKGSCPPPVQRPQAPLGLTPGQGSCSRELPRGRRLLFRSCRPSRRAPNFSPSAAADARPPLLSLLKCGSGRQHQNTAAARASGSRSRRNSAMPSLAIAFAVGSRPLLPLEPAKPRRRATTSSSPAAPRSTGLMPCYLRTLRARLPRFTGTISAAPPSKIAPRPRLRTAKKVQRDRVSPSVYDEFPPSLPGSHKAPALAGAHLRS